MRVWCSDTEEDNSGLVKMLWIGAAIPLGQAAVAWRWRFSVRDEMHAQNGKLSDAKAGGNTSDPTHVVIADYTPSFERAVAASKNDLVTRIPQSTETSEVRAKQTVAMLKCVDVSNDICGRCRCSGLKCNARRRQIPCKAGCRRRSYSRCRRQ